MSPDVLLAELCAPFVDGALVHLNNAVVSPLSARAERAAVELAALMRDGTHAVPRLLKKYEAARSSFGRLVGCDADDVAFFHTCAAAISQVACGFPLQAGDSIVLLDQEYPSNFYPWCRAAEKVGATVVVVESGPDWTVDHDKFIDAITAQTRVVAVSFVQFQTGAVADLARIVAAAHKVGAIVVVDAIQGLGIMPFSMRELGVDAVCGGSHKWLLGPLGHGFLALTPALRGRLTPVLQGAITYGTPDDAVDATRPPRADIRRFEPGAPLALGAIPSAASIDLLLGIGIDRLHKEATAISDIVVDEARRRGFAVRPRTLSPIVAFVPNGDVHEQAARLRAEGISLAVRGAGLRVSPHAFNSNDDIVRLFSALAR